ncbi:hypothetical protein BDY21DRAFT_39215 [Lineolata rhizophorae]|uniref:Uncharacterized protein n=1 Tax=Lineolata rhizophorae TaxID=578093 RepID=A0A6A6P0B0_9PEZI|nr:hypothetical protein BDY21DRAFT_39215 [Lineolata rhizophorae]
MRIRVEMFDNKRHLVFHCQALEKVQVELGAYLTARYASPGLLERIGRSEVLLCHEVTVYKVLPHLLLLLRKVLLNPNLLWPNFVICVGRIALRRHRQVSLDHETGVEVDMARVEKFGQSCLPSGLLCLLSPFIFLSLCALCLLSPAFRLLLCELRLQKEFLIIWRGVFHVAKGRTLEFEEC